MTSLDHADAVGLLARQTEILEQIAAGGALSGVLTGIATTFEDLVPGCCCSVLLLDGGTLRHGAAPSLPAAYSSAIDGLSIGEYAGSCGTAAYTGRPVVAVDVRLDVRWESYRSLADQFGLRACWSTPISGRDGITGTFAVYHPSPHRPTPRETHLVERLTHLASVAIDHDRLLGALTESEERFRRAFEDNAVGMALATRDGRVTRVNRAMRALLGRSLIGAGLDELFTRRGGTDRQDQYEATARAADGRILDLAIAVSPIQDHALSVNVLDVTGKRAAERERRRRVEAELAQHAAEAANRAKTDFVSALGHELRTPLQAITGFTELLGTLDLDRDRRTAALDHISAAAGHILAMVNDVLDVARIEANVLPLTVTAVPLEPVVADVLAMLEPLAAAERVGLRVSAGAPADLLGDKRRIRQVLLNLAANAVRYNRADGTVVLGWTVHDGQARITVRDTGPGMADEYLDRLFVPFDRLGADSEEGVGLGLPLARGLTEAMGGSLDVYSELGQGTTVTVRLPLAQPR
ncbi:ATP-binding protein [Cryptosporangium sp. NPDC051539]|uniref:GAF domain-containing sensor histidine kinase n=1 Tax=Cryptosporangium sp. NPDC051539 TaxID=3363962 RepID=UPI00379E443F